LSLASTRRLTQQDDTQQSLNIIGLVKYSLWKSCGYVDASA
jgi:hypothetical protein